MARVWQAFHLDIRMGLGAFPDRNNQHLLGCQCKWLRSRSD